MATVLEGFTTEEQRSVARFFCGQRDSVRRIFTKKSFLFAMRSICHVERFTSGSSNSLKGVRSFQMMPHRARKWLRQQSKHLYGAGFEALVKRWDKCINAGGGYVVK
jgi:hypothetical protein